MEGERKTIIEELRRGHEFANQLRQVLLINGDDDDDDDDELAITATPFAKHLSNNVLKSFSNTLFLLDKYPNKKSHHEVLSSQILQQSWEFPLTSSPPAKSEDSGQESCKSSAAKEYCRRGCYKRRKTTETLEKVSKIPTYDGHQWRKYGQKRILNTKYSRDYYRCTHKFDQICQATKQVQRIQEEPPLYKTTYYGHHSCKNFLNPEIMLDPSSPHHGTSILLSFNNTFPTPTKQDCPFLSSPVKEDYLLSSEPTSDNSTRHVTLSSTLESNHKDVMYGGLYDSVELYDVFQSNLLGFEDQLSMF